MSQQLLITERDFCPQTGDVPTTMHDRIAGFVVQSITGMLQVPSTSKEESIMPGTRFNIGGFKVAVGPIKVTVSRTETGGAK